MPIDIATEELITPAQASNRLPGRPHRSAVYRWIHDPRDDRRLESVLIGGRRFTSIEAINRWVARLNGEAADCATSLSESRRRQIEAADRINEEAGV